MQQSIKQLSNDIQKELDEITERISFLERLVSDIKPLKKSMYIQSYIKEQKRHSDEVYDNEPPSQRQRIH